MDSFQGLSAAEVAQREAAGQRHHTRFEGTRTYRQIVRENLFGTINVSLLTIGLALVLLDRVTDAVISAGIVVINVAVGMIQEVRAKRRLDHIALLTRPKVTVIRDGQEQEIRPDQVVLNDIIIIDAGDQIIVDGLIHSGRIQVDESLLTGEEDLVTRATGDDVASGSICVSGRAVFEATRVGSDSLAARITASARAFRRSLTPLQEEVNLILRLLLVMTAFFGLILLLSSIIHDAKITEAVLAAAVIAGLVPPGLFLMITLNYAMAAVRLASLDALIQQSNAVDSLSNVDILCLDKTGTLTANKLRLARIVPIGERTEPELQIMLGDYAATVSAGNKTTTAIADACSGRRLHANDEVPFSSAWKWSAISFDDPERRGVVALGAPEMLGRLLAFAPEQPADVLEDAGNGYRVLLLAAGSAPANLSQNDETPSALPDDCQPVAWLVFADELRPHSQETLESFRSAGITLKVISGDNPSTVAALARQAGLSRTAAVSGLELDGLSDAQLADIAESSDVFGRITPQQKERLVQALRRRGHYVAMIGDGVNDVLSLKEANLGIAMESGSAATRSVADIVLLNDSFGALPAAFREGQRIRSGMQDILKLFMVRVFSVALLLISAVALQAGFPFSPRQISILSTLTVGVPVFFIAIWARPELAKNTSILRSLVHFVAPAAMTVTLTALAVYLIFYTGHNPGGMLPGSAAISEQSTGGTALTEVSRSRDAITVTSVLCGLLLLVFVEPPVRFLARGDRYSGDWRPTILAGLMGACLVVILSVPFLRDFFGMGRLSPGDFLLISSIVAVWAVVLQLIWKYRLLDRLLGISVSAEALGEPVPSA